jgi:putative ABC transport system substrate-binding protein
MIQDSNDWPPPSAKVLTNSAGSMGRNVRIDYRFGGGNSSTMPQLLREMIQLRPDVILAATTPAATAARQQTLSLPIVFVQVPDAVSAGYVTSTTIVVQCQPWRRQ